MTFWFDWELVKNVLAEGMDIPPVTIMGEVEDIQWFRGTAYIHTGNRNEYMPLPGGYFTAGATVPIKWNAASGAEHSYSVGLSRDGGLTWETLATELTGTSFDWTATGSPTANAIIRVSSFDLVGNLLGYDDTNTPFTINSFVSPCPRPVDGRR